MFVLPLKPTLSKFKMLFILLIDLLNLSIHIDKKKILVYNLS
nr:MAG TPA: hypothetical protein [Caudoviricetes sp.]